MKYDLIAYINMHKKCRTTIYELTAVEEKDYASP